jgi:hypothetical protein
LSEIVKIEVKNFQSHEHTVIVPAPAGELTVLVGQSDQGKTAILRALRYACYNTPQGSDFIRVGANSTSVKIDYADGRSVARSRSHKGLNRYEIAGLGKEPEKFEGFGSTVPLEVQQITGVRPVEIGDLSINLNLASQLEGPFLGSSVSAPTRAKVLGKLAGTEEVDYAARTAKTDLLHRKQDDERLTNDEKRLQASVKEYTYLVELGEKIDAAEILLAGIQKKTERVERLNGLREQRAQIDSQWGKTIQAILNLTDVIRAEVFATNAAQMIELRTKLQKGRNDLDAIGGQLKDAGHVLTITDQIEESGVLYEATRSNYDQFGRLAGLRSDLLVIGSQIAAEKYTLDCTQRTSEAETTFSCAAKRETQHSYLSGRKVSLSMITQQIERAQRTLNATKDINKIIECISTAQNNINLLYTLRSASKELGDYAQDIGIMKRQMEALTGIDEATSLLESTRVKLGNVGRIGPLRNSYDLCSTNIRQSGNEVTNFARLEQRLSDEYRTALLAAGVCPTCGSQITEDALKEAI